MNYTILVIDDDEPIHVMTKKLLGSEFNLKHARNAQQAVDILSEHKINLVLSDIHMPGISGLEFLESLKDDTERSSIPVLIMTNLPTIEKEKKALDLGAADFIKKEQFLANKEAVLDLIRMKIVSDVSIPNLDAEISKNKNKLVMKLMEVALSSDFQETVIILCEELVKLIHADFVGYWAIENEEAHNLHYIGENFKNPAEIDSFRKSKTLKTILNAKKSDFSNHIYNSDFGSFIEYSKNNSLPAELAVPIFGITERDLLMNKMSVPDNARIFGIIVLKRDALYSSSEFEFASRLLTQTGSILYRLYQKSLN